MNIELKEKMQQAADEYAKDMSPLSRQQSNDSYSFMKGAIFMYAELSPLVEWVRVKDKLPEQSVEVLAKNRYGENKICSYASDEWWVLSANNKFRKIKGVTHWRRIE